MVLLRAPCGWSQVSRKVTSSILAEDVTGLVGREIGSEGGGRRTKELEAKELENEGSGQRMCMTVDSEYSSYMEVVVVYRRNQHPDE